MANNNRHLMTQVLLNKLPFRKNKCIYYFIVELDLRNSWPQALPSLFMNMDKQLKTEYLNKILRNFFFTTRLF